MAAAFYHLTGPIWPNLERGCEVNSAQAKGLSLCFLQGAGLPDPGGLLRGSGHVVRNIRLDSAATLEHADVCALIDLALQRAKTQLLPDCSMRQDVSFIEGSSREGSPS